MKAVGITALACAIALALPAVAKAESESDWEFAGEVTITTDYVWRGVSQTSEDPALQAGFEASHSSGFYAGVWGSNVDFDDPDDGIDLEVDLFVGFAFDLNENLNLDLSATRYFYPGANSGYNIDYNEYAATLTIQEQVFFSVAYADDMVNSDVESMYYQLGGEWEFGDSGWGWSAAIGHFDFDSDIGDYSDLSLGISRSFSIGNVALTHTRTFGFDEGVQDFLGPSNWAGNRTQLSLTFEF